MEKTPVNRIEAKSLEAPRKLLHWSDADEGHQNAKQVDECSSLYYVMRECYYRSNRNWKECQPEVQALGQCFQRRKKNKV
ncbi:hypothetical protein CR513_59810, partial [Mucuna pruriens]